MDGFTWTTLIAKPNWLLKNGYLQSFKRLATPGKRRYGLSGVLDINFFSQWRGRGRLSADTGGGPGQESKPVRGRDARAAFDYLHFDGSSVTTALSTWRIRCNGKNYQTLYGCTRDPKDFLDRLELV